MERAKRSRVWFKSMYSMLTRPHAPVCDAAQCNPFSYQHSCKGSCILHFGQWLMCRSNLARVEKTIARQWHRLVYADSNSGQLAGVSWPELGVTANPCRSAASRPSPPKRRQILFQQLGLAAGFLGVADFAEMIAELAPVRDGFGKHCTRLAAASHVVAVVHHERVRRPAVREGPLAHLLQIRQRLVRLAVSGTCLPGNPQGSDG